MRRNNYGLAGKACNVVGPARFLTLLARLDLPVGIFLVKLKYRINM